eukprot:gene31105-40450_t
MSAQSIQQKDYKTQLQELLSMHYRVPISTLLQYKTELFVDGLNLLFHCKLTITIPERQNLEYESLMDSKKKAQQYAAQLAFSDIQFKLSVKPIVKNEINYKGKLQELLALCSSKKDADQSAASKAYAHFMSSTRSEGSIILNGSKSYPQMSPLEANTVVGSTSRDAVPISSMHEHDGAESGLAMTLALATPVPSPSFAIVGSDCSTPSPSTISSITVASGNNYKGKLQELLARDHKGAVATYINLDVARKAGFQSVVTITNLQGGQSIEPFRGEVCSSKKDADQSAASKAYAHFMSCTRSEGSIILNGSKSYQQISSLEDGSIVRSSSRDRLSIKMHEHDGAESSWATPPPSPRCSIEGSVYDIDTPSRSTISSISTTTGINYKGCLQQLVVSYYEGAAEITYCANRDSSGGFQATINMIDGSTTVGPFPGEVCLRIKDAEQSAASKALEGLNSMINNSFEIEKNLVACRNCNHSFGSLDNFFFFKKSESEVLFGLKPELLVRELSSPTAAYFVHADGSQKVSCVACESCVGHKMELGLNAASIITFGQKKILVLGVKVWQAWQKYCLLPHTVSIDCRDLETFWPLEMSSMDVETATPMVPLIMPTHKDEYFKWEDLIHAGKKPHKYQLEGYYRALLSNLIVCIPTGKGKTLIAALVMARMKRINPCKLVVLIVERIPLVFQQARAIALDTTLSLCQLCSETNTQATINKLLNNTFDGLVATAGSFLDLLYKKKIIIEQFSVIVVDECHHTVGSHSYRKLLEIVRKTPFDFRPRLLGLSASPACSSTVAKAREKLDKLCHDFDRAKIYCPELSMEPTKIEWIAVELSKQQECAQVSLSQQLAPVLKELLRAMNSSKTFNGKEVANSQRWCEFVQIIADAEEVVAQEQGPYTQFIARAKELLSALEVNYLLGPSFNDDTWEKFSRKVSSTGENMAVTTVLEKSKQDGINLSSQLHALLNVLSSTDVDARILVFVITRYTASKLRTILSLFFPNYHCEVIVGKEGFGGMQWRGDAGQENVLQRFRTGETRLIVSTSVLEEGIDVQNCDVVVRFGGQPALIQLIQSKGRARKENGKLFVIHTMEEKTHFDKVTNQEAVMKIALKKYSQPEDGLIQSLGGEIDSISTIDSTKCMVPYTLEDQSLLNRLSLSISEGYLSVPAEPCLKTSAVVLYVQSCSSNLQKIIYDELMMSLVAVEIQRVEVFISSASTHIAAPGIFDSGASLALVSFKSIFSDVIRTMAANLTFRLSSGNPFWLAPIDSSVNSLSQLDSKANNKATVTIKDSSIDSIVWDKMKRMTCGCFVGPNKFEQRADFSLSERKDWTYSTMEITPDRVLKIIALSSQMSVHKSAILHNIGGVQFNRKELQNGITICCPLDILGSCVFASVDRGEREFTLYVTLKSTPKVFAVTDGVRQRVCVVPDHHQNDGNTPAILNFAREDLKNLSQSPVISLCFPLELWDVMTSTLFKSSILGVPLLITRVDAHKIESAVIDTLTEEVAYTGSEVWDSFWTMASLLHDHYCIALNSEVVAYITGLYMDACWQKDWPGAGIIAMAIQQTRLTLKEGNLWMNAKSVFDDSMEIVKLTYNERVSFSENFSWETRLPDGHVMMDRIVLTPSRLLPDESVPVKSNRLLRKFSSKYHFVYATFRDEQGQRIYDEQVFRNRFMVMLKDGFRMCGKQYKYLFSSASQLREGMGVFVAGDKADVETIRRALIPDLASCGKGPAKVLSRLGLFCTADFDYFLLDIEDVEFNFPDLKTPKGELLTDGSGFILTSFLETIEIYASLIQVRVYGCKGTLLSMPSLRGSGDKKIQFRDSMQKCESPHNTLCVVKEACYNPLRLNREIINLLCSFQGEGAAGGDWSPHQALVDLVDDALKGSVEILLSQSAAQRTLEKFFSDGTIEKLASSGVNLLAEPLWLSLLRRIYDQETLSLRMKTHIPLKQGCLLMGAPDPLGLLQDGQIFARIRRPITQNDDDCGSFERDSEGYEVITGTVIIYRNPCLDPGDVRILEAVDIPELHNWKNVILLPAAESCYRSIAADCSGGDVDGDHFAIIWDRRLIPPKHREFDPVDYAEILTEAKKALHQCPTEKSEEEFVGDTMRNSFLGKIANSHLAISDQLLSDKANERGAGHPIARNLARQQSIAVDCPKTGIFPDVPAQVKSMIREYGYPDFMEKKDKKTYKSRNTLGCLYRIVVATACSASFSQEQLDVPDPTFTCPGFQPYISRAKVDYKIYVLELKRMFIRFGISTEAELLLGLPRDSREESTTNVGTVAAALHASWKALRSSFELRFESYGDGYTERKCRACAWYHVAYQDKNGYRSFGWIMIDLLCEIHASNAQFEQQSSVLNRDVSLEVGRSVLKEWDDEKKLLHNAVRCKYRLFNRICDTIRKSPTAIQTDASLDICMFGSVALLLNDHGSDLDIYANFSDSPVLSDDIVLNDVIRPSVSDIATNVKFIKSTAVPIVRMEIEEGNIKTHVDISAMKESVWKTRFIRHHYAIDPTNLPFFRSINQWAKACGIVRGFSTEKRKSLLNTGQLQALMLSYVSSRPQYPEEIDLREMEKNSNSSDKLLINGCKAEHAESLGEKILGFLMFAITVSEPPNEDVSENIPPGSEGLGDNAVKPFRFVWKIPGEPVHEISVEVLRHIAQRAKRAYHALAVSRSWDFTISQAAAFEQALTTLEIKLTRSLSKSIEDSRDFLCLRFSYKSGGAQVSTYTVSEDKCTVFTGEGTHQQIQLLRKEILKLTHFDRAMSYGAFRSKANKYFMDGATMLFARQAESPQCMLALEPYAIGQVNRAHRERASASTLIMRSAPCGDDSWMKTFQTAFVAKTLDQLSSMDAEASKDLIFAVHFGKFYMIDAERCFDRQQGSMPCADIETAVANGKKNQKVGVERPEYDPYSSVPDDRAALLSSSSSPARKPSANANRGNGMRNGAGDGFATSSAKKGQFVSTSFWSSLPVNDHDSTTVGAEETIEIKFRAIAKDLGYEQIAKFVEDDSSALCVSNDSDDFEPSALRSGPISGTTLTLFGTAWKIEVIASASYSTHISTTSLPRTVSCPDSEADDMLGSTSDTGKEKDLGSEEVVETPGFSVHERFLSWINATLLCAHDSSAKKNIEVLDECCDESEEVVKKKADSEVLDSFRHHDLRIKVGNNRRVPKKTELYEAVIPQGHIPVEINEAGRPTVRPDTGMKDKITFIRRVKSRIVFGSPGLLAHLRGQTAEQDSDDGHNSSDFMGEKMTLIVTIGIHYEGVGLQEEVPFIDLSLDGDMSEVRNWIQGQGQGSLEVAKQSLSCTIEEVLRVSERIRKLW